MAMIDPMKSPMFCYEPITDINGTVCYPNCKAPDCIIGLNGNCKTSYCGNYRVNTTNDKYKFYFDFINDNDYCIPTDNITTKSSANDNVKNGCDNNKDDTFQTLVNYGTLTGLFAALLFMILICLILRRFGFRCVKVETTFVSDQFTRDKDQYLL